MNPTQSLLTILLALGLLALLILALALARSLAGQWGAIDRGESLGGEYDE